jgi:sugar lactone lactonase YvrE
MATVDTLPMQTKPKKPRRSLLRLVIKGLFLILTFLLVMLGIFLLLPSPVNAQAWSPPPAPPMSGVLAPNDLLRKAELVANGQIQGSEDIAVDAQGRIYVGNQDGRILRITFSSDGRQDVQVFANDKGYPLDMAFDANGNLIVANWLHGLVSYDQTGKMTVLIPVGRPIESEKFLRPDGIAVSRDGTIYVSLGSVRDVPAESYSWFPELLEQKPYGRLVAFNPQTKEIKVL